MYKHLVVPLDQSDSAEQALPHAVSLAQALEAKLSLVGVLNVVDPEALESAGAPVDWGAQADLLSRYLEGVAQALTDQGLDCEWEVLQGDVGEQILQYAADQDADLIVMATHARTGLGKWIYGSVAERILTRTPVPLLLVRAQRESED